ncbi:MAG: AI-2E family transporter, partial [Hyphomicrobiales bacterium]|nr:AI-2E family transporter [Hyphomicrobiales bacterium]
MDIEACRELIIHPCFKAMTNSSQYATRIGMLAVGLATIAISAVFIGMIWDFLIALFLAAVFSAMASPLYEKVLSVLGDKKGIAAAATLLILFICVLVPILALVYLAAIQAQELTTNIVSFVQRVDVEGVQFEAPEWMPFGQELERAGTITTSKVGELAGSIAGFFVSAVSAVTKGTASFFLSLFILIYAMVFFLQEQTNVLAQLMHYS